MLKEELVEDKLELIKSGQNFLGILNDIKRRPEDAASELGVTLEEINLIISGQKAASQEILEKAVKIWPVNARDFYIIRDDCPTGIKIMTMKESEKSSRIMDRAGKSYYEYRDTAMSSVAPFRPEWIMELCYVDNNNPNNPLAQSAITGMLQASTIDVATFRNSVIVIMLASGKARVAEIAKLPAQMASNPCVSTIFADIASNAPPTLTKLLESSFFRKISV